MLWSGVGFLLLLSAVGELCSYLCFYATVIVRAFRYDDNGIKMRNSQNQFNEDWLNSVEVTKTWNSYMANLTQ